jgi:hypothetical protein
MKDNGVVKMTNKELDSFTNPKQGMGGYQPDPKNGHLDPNNPPKGGSGVPNKKSFTDNYDKYKFTTLVVMVEDRFFYSYNKKTKRLQTAWCLTGAKTFRNTMDGIREVDKICEICWSKGKNYNVITIELKREDVTPPIKGYVYRCAKCRKQFKAGEDKIYKKVNDEMELFHGECYREMTLL